MCIRRRAVTRKLKSSKKKCTSNVAMSGLAFKVHLRGPQNRRRACIYSHCFEVDHNVGRKFCNLYESSWYGKKALRETFPTWLHLEDGMARQKIFEGSTSCRSVHPNDRRKRQVAHGLGSYTMDSGFLVFPVLRLPAI